jgi:hypothetical protein
LLDEKQKELSSDEIKKMIYKQIDKKQKQVDPTKHNMRIVENNLTELETMQFILSMIIDEEQLRKRNEPTIQEWDRIR